jgi:hypothetical protein
MEEPDRMSYVPKYQWLLCPVEVNEKELYIKWYTNVGGELYYTACRAPIAYDPFQEAERRIDEIRRLH